MIDAKALIAEVNSKLEVTEARKAEAVARLTQLTETARSLRDEANDLLVDCHLSDELYEQLSELDNLPTGEIELSDWIFRAKVTIAETREYLSRFTATPQGGVSDDALTALAERFNNRN